MTNSFKIEVDRFELLSDQAGPIEAIRILGLPDVSVGLGGTLTLSTDQSWRFVQRLSATLRELADILDNEPTPPPPVAMAMIVVTQQCFLWRLLRCPFCGGKHTHAGGAHDGNPHDYLGDRFSNCTSGPGMGQLYNLVDAYPCTKRGADFK